MALDALTAMPRLISKDLDFPKWYAELFQRRWRFNSSRLALEETVPDGTLLAAMAPKTPVDQAVMRLLAPWLRFGVGRLATLAWLTLRLKPYRLRDIAATALDRGRDSRQRDRPAAPNTAHRAAQAPALPQTGVGDPCEAPLCRLARNDMPPAIPTPSTYIQPSTKSNR